MSLKIMNIDSFSGGGGGKGYRDIKDRDLGKIIIFQNKLKSFIFSSHGVKKEKALFNQNRHEDSD